MREIHLSAAAKHRSFVVPYSSTMPETATGDIHCSLATHFLTRTGCWKTSPKRPGKDHLSMLLTPPSILPALLFTLREMGCNDRWKSALKQCHQTRPLQHPTSLSTSFLTSLAESQALQSSWVGLLCAL